MISSETKYICYRTQRRNPLNTVDIPLGKMGVCTFRLVGERLLIDFGSWYINTSNVQEYSVDEAEFIHTYTTLNTIYTFKRIN